MEQRNTRQDPIAALLESTGASAIIQVDETGQRRIVFSEEERERFTRYLVEELRDGIDAAQDRWAKAKRLLAVYEAVGENKETIVPVAKRNANQTIAYIVQTILGRTPIASAKPQDFGMMEIVYQSPEGPVIDEASIEEVAEGMEALLQDILESRVDFRGALTEFVSDMVIGMGVPLLKWCYEYEERKIKRHDIEPAMPGGGVPGVEAPPGKQKAKVRPFPKSVSVAKGCPHKIIPISTLNFLYPVGTTDIQEAPWVAERIPKLDGMTLQTRIQNKVYDFGLPEGTEPPKELVERILTGKPADRADAPVWNDEEGAKQNPRDYGDAFEVWPIWPIRHEDGSIEIFLLETHFHLGAEEILYVKDTPYHHGLRPYTPGFFRKKSHQFDSYSVVEDMEPFQELISSLYRLEIQNGVQSNLKAYMARRGSPAHADLMRKKARGGVRPGDIIEFADPNEVVPFQTGGQMGSLMQPISFAMAEADRGVNLSGLDRGEVPGRTADAAIARVHEQATMQRAMALEATRAALSLGFYMLLENVRQFSPTGESLAVFDPRKRAMQERVIAMPTDAIQEKFRIVVNASSQDQTKDAERERLTIDYQMILGSNDKVLEAAAALFNPETTEPYEKVIQFALTREEDALKRLLALHRNDAETATLDLMEIEAILQAKRDALAMQQQQAAMAPPEQQPGMMDPSMMGQDPSMMGQMDPSMMGQQQPPMDPAMMQQMMQQMGGMPPGGMPNGGVPSPELQPAGIEGPVPDPSGAFI